MFCPSCSNDTLSTENIYTSEDGFTEYCYDECDYCGYREDYECDDLEEGEFE